MIKVSDCGPVEARWRLTVMDWQGGAGGWLTWHVLDLEELALLLTARCINFSDELAGQGV